MYKKLSCILLCLIFLVSISSVVAEDTIETNSSTLDNIVTDEYNSEDEINFNKYSNEQIWSDTYENNVLNAQYSLDGGNFKDIQNIIDKANSGDTIILNGNFIAEDESSTITINKKLNITSTNVATLDGTSKTRIFNIKSNAEGLVINNLIFKNAYVSEKYGGAILLNSPNVIISNCEFHDNCALSGGAIATPDVNVNANNLIIKNSKFYSNHASSFAGSILYISMNLEIISCIFDSNYAELQESMGGGSVMQIGFENKDNNCKITDCIFNNNYVTPDNYGHAGVACLRRGVSFINCNFTNNHAYDVGVLGFHDGGSVINCRFYNNYAIESGGVLKFDSTNQSIIVEDSYFENNTAKQGGAIFFNSESSIKNCTFISNTATSGGAIYSNSKFNIDDCIFKLNHAIDGGVIYNSNILFVQNSYFTDNYANNNGGAIYNLGTFNSKNCQYQTNKAKSTLYLTKNSPVKCSDNAIIKATLEGGNNIINAIWSTNTVTINDKSINPNNKISSQTITLNIGGKIFNSITNNNGEAIFKFNTKISK